MVEISDERTYQCNKCEKHKNMEVTVRYGNSHGDLSVTEWVMNERREGGINEESYLFTNPTTGESICAFHFSVDANNDDVFENVDQGYTRKDEEYEKNTFVCGCDGKTYVGMRDMIVHFESEEHLNFIREMNPAANMNDNAV